MTLLRKFLRAIVAVLVLLLVILPAGVYLIVSTPWAQEKLREVACHQLTTLLGTRVSIGEIAYNPFNTLSLNSVRIDDPSGKPALQAARIAARFEILTFVKTGRLDFDYAVVYAPEVNLYRATPDSPLNIQPILDKLKSKEPKKEPTRFELKISTVALRRGAFNYDILSVADSVTDRISPAHIHVSDINIFAYLRRGSNEGWDIDLEELSLSERSGLQIDNLSADIAFSPEKLTLRRFSLDMPGSSISLQPLSLPINGYESIAETLRRRSINLLPTEAVTFTPSDLGWLVPTLRKVNDRFTIDFTINASLREVHVNKLIINGPDHMELSLLGSAVNIDRTEDIEINLLKINASVPAKRLSQILGSSNGKAAETIGTEGDITVTGSARANISEANIDLTLQARNASVSFDGDLTTPDRYRSITFSGQSEIKNFNVAMVAPLGEDLTVDARIDGAGDFSPSGFTIDAHADIAQLDWRGHPYTGITAAGSYNSQTRSAHLALDSSDDEALLNITADLEPSPTQTHIFLDGSISHLDLKRLARGALSKYTVGGRVLADLTGSTADDLSGLLTLHSATATDTAGRVLTLSQLDINIDRSGPNDIVTIASDYLNGHAQGRVAPTTLLPTLKHIASRVMPELLGDDVAAPTGAVNDFTADFTINNIETLAEYFRLPAIPIAPVDISASINGPAHSATLTVDAPYLQNGDKFIDQTVVMLEVDSIDDRATLFATAQIPSKKGAMTAVLGVTAADNRFDTRVDWMLDSKIPLNGQFNFSTLMTRDQAGALCVATDFNPGQINFGDSMWEMGKSSVLWCDGRLDFDDFSLSSGRQRIDINGLLSNRPEDTIEVDLLNISLLPIFETLDIDAVTISGSATGHFEARGALSSSPQINTECLHVDSIGYNYCTLGDADIVAHWDNAHKAVVLDGDVTNPRGEHSRIWGEILPVAEGLNLNFDATHINAGFLKPFLAAFTSDVTGTVSGRARLFGPFKDIDLEGDVLAENVKMMLTFTNTWYTANDSVHIQPGLIKLDDVTIADIYGNTAKLNGYLRHRYFRDPVFEFTVSDAHNILAYNTNAQINPIWYGTVFADGGLTVKGKPGIVTININMTTAPNTNFNLVLNNNRMDAAQYSFIKFNDITPVQPQAKTPDDDIPDAVRLRRQSAAAVEESQPSVTIVDIVMDISPSAELTIIMDPVSDDRIRANGTGTMNVEYNSADNSFGIRGNYTLDRGIYNFTLQDIIHKEFIIEPGSTIAFKGDPEQAELNLKAAYAINANLSDLDESFSQDRDLNRTNVPVQALLEVSGDMRQPDISFDLRFPTLTSDTYRKVRSIISTEDMMSRQIIYLLTLNRFYTPDYMANTTKSNEIFSVAASTITSQISSMLGKLSDKWSIAPNLRSDRGDFSDLEVDVALSSRLLNNRLLLNGNFGYRDRALNNNQFIGDFDIEYLLTDRGTWRLRAYNRSNDQNYYLRQAATTQGVGLMFKRDFDSLLPRRRRPSPADSLPADTTSRH